MANAFQDLFDGRLILGLGAGNQIAEHTASGIDFDRRVGRFAEYLKVLTALMKGEFDLGREPPPHPARCDAAHPAAPGADPGRGRRRAHARPDRPVTRTPETRRRRRRAGLQDPARPAPRGDAQARARPVRVLEITASATVMVAPDAGDGRALRRDADRGSRLAGTAEQVRASFVVGTPYQVAATLRGRLDWGASHLILGIGAQPFSLWSEPMLELFAGEVLPEPRPVGEAPMSRPTWRCSRSSSTAMAALLRPLARPPEMDATGSGDEHDRGDGDPHLRVDRQLGGRGRWSSRSSATARRSSRQRADAGALVGRIDKCCPADTRRRDRGAGPRSTRPRSGRCGGSRAARRISGHGRLVRRARDHPRGRALGADPARRSSCTRAGPDLRRSRLTLERFLPAEQWRRNQYAVLLCIFVSFLGFSFVIPFLPLYIRELGVRDTGQAALLAGLDVRHLAALLRPARARLGQGRPARRQDHGPARAALVRGPERADVAGPTLSPGGRRLLDHCRIPFNHFLNVITGRRRRRSARRSASCRPARSWRPRSGR